ncbi:Chondroitin sulfate synthase 2 [Platysternon megacephalum]|uniref:Chondroitin sulfate synthase 2 n=1 Tax=Platysternon megacephalum TaxID=55544 RepID=A0A4D9DXF2_9SAUR|nr:Chondroitin sulfate synthase 2 [Platysternon megacephalum]
MKISEAAPWMEPGWIKACIPLCIDEEFESGVCWGVLVHPGDMAEEHAKLLLNIMSDWRKARSLPDCDTSQKVKALYAQVLQHMLNWNLILSEAPICLQLNMYLSCWLQTNKPVLPLVSFMGRRDEGSAVTSF